MFIDSIDFDFVVVVDEEKDLEFLNKFDIFHIKTNKKHVKTKIL